MPQHKSEKKDHKTSDSQRSEKSKGMLQFKDQRTSTDHIESLQNMANDHQRNRPVQKKSNKTGLPDQLKSGIENLSGLAMDDVKVNFNSSKPSQLGAHAYAQGSSIHVAPGQEKHLPHEAWHVAQQKQGRVKPTQKLGNGVAINDDKGLEKEADVMGVRSMQLKIDSEKEKITNDLSATEIVQSKWLDDHGPYLKWDVPVEGVLWFFIKSTGLMFFEVATKTGERFRAMSGKKNAKPRSDWVHLYGSDPMKYADASVVAEHEVFTDSEDDSDDPEHEGVRIKKLSKSGSDLAEFDRLRLKRGKIYEDKMATFDQSKTPVRHRKPIGDLVAAWIKKQVIGKVSSKINVIESINGKQTVRCHERTGESPEVIMQWFNRARRFKVVVSGESEVLRSAMETAIRQLREKYPNWRITAKIGDPKGREDHDKMHDKN